VAKYRRRRRTIPRTSSDPRSTTYPSGELPVIPTGHRGADLRHLIDDKRSHDTARDLGLARRTSSRLTGWKEPPAA